jgi:hypothetical protein
MYRFSLLIVIATLLSGCNDKPEGAEVEFSAFAAFPNPASSVIVVSVQNDSADDYHVSVVNPYGETIFDEKVNPGWDEDFNVNIREEKAGYFFVILHTGKETFTRKILKL